ncbi:MAG TPA: response regulator transcription factor [Anaerolineae bacterium]|nr:response regulator transcription factor [Anaerolineae bacterium]
MIDLFLIEPEPRLARTLQNHHELRIVHSVKTIPAAPKETSPCDLILVSARLPKTDIVPFLNACAQAERRAVVIDVEESESALVPLLEAGAVGYVPRSASDTEFVSILKSIYEGKPPLAPNISTALVERMNELLTLQRQNTEEFFTHDYGDLATLTAREREILRLIRRGASNQEIAAELMIEPGTVKNHVHNILKKLNVSRRTQAARFFNLLERHD